jgi:hypothetical protein
MPERKGAAYRISSTRPASHHGEHTQRTQATQWTEQYGKLTAGTQGLRNWRPGSTSEAAYQAQQNLSGMNIPGIAEAKKASWDKRYPGAVK